MTPLSLGVAAANGETAVIIKRNTTVPTRKQAQVRLPCRPAPGGGGREAVVRIVEGERRRVRDNSVIKEGTYFVRPELVQTADDVDGEFAPRGTKCLCYPRSYANGSV